MDFLDKELLEPLGLEVKDAVKDVLYNHLTKDKKPVENLAILFMAGSPAAGKTELINNTIKSTSMANFVRIDADDFRWWFPYYNEKNSVCFQKPASKLVDVIFKKSLKDRYQVIMDSTFASKGIAEQNFDAALKANYAIVLNYVYLDPAVAWVYAQERTRVVPLDVLKRNFIAGREVIEHVLEKYEGRFTLNVFLRQVDSNSPSGFTVTQIKNVTKATWSTSHSCPYKSIEDLAHLS
ncbi:zeta toxin family protein [[Curtobacterium] plantarum]|uniref:zeta toxin family protein n=1 Tax=[Curtobacterium] plantarum TaxID=221276 RepID=UPI000F089778|nr:zeta toxin family protein [[Curtobacterium] plantarum]RNA73516.1 hypothetical protein EBO33_21755 [[Curtobacterium] plantarum]